MALKFGHDEHPPNHIHNIKPLVALPYYQLFTTNLFKYASPIRVGTNVWPKRDEGVPSRYIITLGWIEPKNTQFELFAHTFDGDNNITNLTMKYELMCFMLDNTIEYKLIDEFDMMPYKIVPGKLDNENHFIFKGQKKFFISDLQPNYKNMFKMCVRIRNTASTVSGIANESLPETVIIHTQKMKPVNDVMIQAIQASTQTT